MLSPRVTRRLRSLTHKERQVLRALANADIAHRLHLGESTAKTHISRILAELELTNRVRAALLAHRAGLNR